MWKALQMSALYVGMSLPFWAPIVLRAYRKQQRQKQKESEIRALRLSDRQRSRQQKAALDKRRAEAARVQLPKPNPDNYPKNQRPPAPKPVPAALLYELDALTKSRATSDRLVDGLGRQHPGKSRRWLTEKAIADLERDRQR